MLVSPANPQDFRGNLRLIRHCEILRLQNRGNPQKNKIDCFAFLQKSRNDKKEHNCHAENFAFDSPPLRVEILPKTPPPLRRGLRGWVITPSLQGSVSIANTTKQSINPIDSSLRTKCYAQNDKMGDESSLRKNEHSEFLWQSIKNNNSWICKCGSVLSTEVLVFSKPRNDKRDSPSFVLLCLTFASLAMTN